MMWNYIHSKYVSRQRSYRVFATCMCDQKIDKLMRVAHVRDDHGGIILRSLQEVSTDDDS